MPAAIAIPLAIGAGTAGAGIIGAKMQAGAADDAAQAQLQASREALAFQKQQAAQDLSNAQAAQRGNYDQWAAKQGRLSTLGQMVGLKPFQIPAYVPIQNVNQVTPTGTNPNVVPMSRAFMVDNRG